MLFLEERGRPWTFGLERLFWTQDNRGWEGSSTESSSDCGAQIKRFQRGIISSKWARDGCDFSGKMSQCCDTVGASRSRPKNLPKAKWKSKGLTSLAEEVSRQPDIDSVMWLEITLRQICSEKQQMGQGGKI